MQYLLLIYDEEESAARHEQEDPSFLSDYRSLSQRIKASGELTAGDALSPSTTATTVRVRGGEVLLTDGPFAETREQIGGYFLVEAENLDRAIAIAAEVPTAKYGGVEVRPLRVFGPRG